MFASRSSTGMWIARFLSIDFAIATCLGLWHMLGMGGCADSATFATVFDCVDSSMMWAMVFGIGLTGSIIISFFTGLSWGLAIMFVPTGLTALAYAIVGEPAPGGDFAAWSIGAVFLLIGLPALYFELQELFGDGDTRPDATTTARANNYMQNMASVNPWAAAPSVPDAVKVVTPAPAQPQAQANDFDAQRKAMGI